MSFINASVVLGRTFTVRQFFRGLIWLTALALVLYLGLLIRNGWHIKMGGIGIAQMRYVDFPIECQKIVDIHRGGVGGTPFEGIENRTIYRDVATLVEAPACWGYMVRAGVDAKPLGSESISNANVRVIFTRVDPDDQSKTIEVLTLRADYHD